MKDSTRQLFTPVTSTFVVLLLSCGFNPSVQAQTNSGATGMMVAGADINRPYHRHRMQHQAMKHQLEQAEFSAFENETGDQVKKERRTIPGQGRPYRRH